MSYCYNCGAKIVNGDLFCSECGCGVESTPMGSMSHDENILHRGVIMTNIAKLSTKLSCSHFDIKVLLTQYMEHLKDCNIEYSLLDVSMYEMQNFINHRDDLDCTILESDVVMSLRDWADNSEVLLKYHSKRFNDNDSPLLLFIIGGDDIIPMPNIINYKYLDDVVKIKSGDLRQKSKGVHNDTSITSDLPYAYMLDSDNLDDVIDGSIFSRQPTFTVGRLPLGVDATIEELYKYLQKAISAHRAGGICIDNVYSHVNKVWRLESAFITQPLRRINSKQSEALTIGGDMVYYHNMVMSPPVSIENISPYLDNDATLLYFHMHGSSYNLDPCFSADSVDEDDFNVKDHMYVKGFHPQCMTQMNRLNFVMTQACYGAKYIGLSDKNSMLLSAINSNTVSYFGSTVTSFGLSRVMSHLNGIRESAEEYKDKSELLGACLLSRNLIEQITSKYLPIGRAVEYARGVFLRSLNHLDPIGMLTLTEFNLFGDPSIKVYHSKENSAESNDTVFVANEKFKVSVKYLASSDNGSILDRIKSVVDHNLSDIRGKLNRYMADNYNLEPRCLSSIAEIEYDSRVKRYDFVYRDMGLEVTYVVQADINGDIKYVLTSI